MIPSNLQHPTLDVQGGVAVVQNPGGRVYKLALELYTPDRKLSTDLLTKINALLLKEGFEFREPPDPLRPR